MLKSSWLLVLLNASFEYIRATAYYPLIETPRISGLTCLMIAALLIFTLRTWIVAARGKIGGQWNWHRQIATRQACLYAVPGNRARRL